MAETRPQDSCGVRRGAVPHMDRPCGRCPWRRDVPPGEFSLERFLALWKTSHQPPVYDRPEEVEQQPMFACHKTPEGQERACAGWLAVAGWSNIAVRIAVLFCTLPREALQPGRDWPELFESFEEMVERQADPPPPADWTVSMKGR